MLSTIIRVSRAARSCSSAFFSSSMSSVTPYQPVMLPLASREGRAAARNQR